MLNGGLKRIGIHPSSFRGNITPGINLMTMLFEILRSMQLNYVYVICVIIDWRYLFPYNTGEGVHQ